MVASSSSVRLRDQESTVNIGHVLTPLKTVSGGFAVVQPGSKLSINAVEGYSLDSFNADVRAYITPSKTKRCMNTADIGLAGGEKSDRRSTEDRRWKRERTRQGRGQH